MLKCVITQINIGLNIFVFQARCYFRRCKIIQFKMSYLPLRVCCEYGTVIQKAVTEQRLNQKTLYLKSCMFLKKRGVNLFCHQLIVNVSKQHEPHISYKHTHTHTKIKRLICPVGINCPLETDCVQTLTLKPTLLQRSFNHFHL